MKIKKGIFALPVLLCLSVGCGSLNNLNTVEGSRYDPEEFSAANIIGMAQVLEDYMLEPWYLSGLTPDNFDEMMEDQYDDATLSVFRSGYRSWYSALEDIGFSSPETLAEDISVGDVVYYINSDEELTVEAQLVGTGENAHPATLEFNVDRHRVPTAISVTVTRTLGEKLVNAGLNTLLGMGMAFFVLIIISLVISAFAVVSGNGRRRPSAGKAAQDAGSAASGAAKAGSVEASISNTMAQIAAKEEMGADAELTAVITAAVMAYEADTGRDGVVTGISRVRQSDARFTQPQLPVEAPPDGVFARPLRNREKRNWKRA